MQTVPIPMVHLIVLVILATLAMVHIVKVNISNIKQSQHIIMTFERNESNKNT